MAYTHRNAQFYSTKEITGIKNVAITVYPITEEVAIACYVPENLALYSE